MRPCTHPDWSFDRTIMDCGAPSCDERMHYWCGDCGISECEAKR